MDAPKNGSKHVPMQPRRFTAHLTRDEYETLKMTMNPINATLHYMDNQEAICRYFSANADAFNGEETVAGAQQEDIRDTASSASTAEAHTELSFHA